MKTLKILMLTLVSVAFIFALINKVSANPGQEYWAPAQMVEPADLNKTLNNPKAKQPVIFCIGPSAVIKNSIDIGPGYDKANINKLKQQLNKLPKNTNIIFYCGCCPYERCPNIRPVYRLMNEMGFTNHHLLNLPRNIKVDWIDKGYAVKG